MKALLQTAGICMMAILITACAKNEDSEAKTPSTTETMIDGMTGRTAVRHGKQAREDIERISAQRDQQLQEALGNPQEE